MDNFTGRDTYLVVQALAYASEWLASLPTSYDELSNWLDMDELLELMQSPWSEVFRQAAREKLAFAGLAQRSVTPNE